MNECAREITWAGGTHVFNLNHPSVIKMMGDGHIGVPAAFVMLGYGTGSLLKGQYGDTPAACLKRFDESVYSIDDVERIIALGLYGGGVAAAEAAALVEKHVRGQAIAPSAIIAYEILAALFIGAQKAEA